MLLRALLLLAAMFFVTATLASVFSPREDRAGRGAAELALEKQTPRRGKPLPAAPRATTRTVRGRMPSSSRVRAREGDIVRLIVTADAPDIVEIPELGVDGPAGPNLPAELLLVADQPGRFKVRLSVSRRIVGELIVRKRPARATPTPRASPAAPADDAEPAPTTVS